VALAHLLARQPPTRMKRLLIQARRRARPATQAEAEAARSTIVAASRSCAGEGCLPRAIATSLLCRMRGTWPTWCTGVRLYPFSAHAWVEADGEPAGESFSPGHYIPVITVPPQTC